MQLNVPFTHATLQHPSVLTTRTHVGMSIESAVLPERVAEAEQ